MKRVLDHLRDLTLAKAGIYDGPDLPIRSLTPEQLREEQWDQPFVDEMLRCTIFDSDDFLDKMRARMVIGYFRYGSVRENARMGVRRDHLKSIRKRLALYEETGNQECLVDVANLCMVEVMNPSCHPDPCDSGADGRGLGALFPTRLCEMRCRVDHYEDQGDQVYLARVAALCLAEYVDPRCHPDPHFASVDDGEHTEDL